MPQKLSQEAYEKKIERNNKYDAENTTRLYIKLNNNTDSDILAYLETLTNKQGAIKQLLRARMEEDGFQVPDEHD